MTGDIALLATLFDKVLVPQTVRDELAHPNAPDLVREWIAHPPPWLEVRPDPDRASLDRITVAQGLLDSLLARRRDEESQQR
jgi:hypothetical protein